MALSFNSPEAFLDSYLGILFGDRIKIKMSVIYEENPEPIIKRVHVELWIHGDFKGYRTISEQLCRNIEALKNKKKTTIDVEVVRTYRNVV